jgi:hypothetical protein
MRLVEELARPRKLHIRPRVVVSVGLLASLVVSALWLAGADRGAMMMLLAGILFPLIAFLAYFAGRDGAMVSAGRGAIVGGLSFPFWSAWLICKSSYEERGVPFPNTLGELFLSLIFSILFLCFGAGIGMMTGVIGGCVIRVSGWFVILAFGRFQKQTGRAKQDGDKGLWLDGPTIL